jgi:DNA-binding Xre family transcriptional regulator
MRITPQDILNETVLVLKSQPENEVRLTQLQNLCTLLDLSWDDVKNAAQQTLEVSQ